MQSSSAFMHCALHVATNHFVEYYKQLRSIMALSSSQWLAAVQWRQSRINHIVENKDDLFHPVVCHVN